MEYLFSELITKLKTILPESSWSWVIPALQEEPLAWKSLETPQEVFGIYALTEIIRVPEDCSPGALALRSLGMPFTVSELRSLPLQSVDKQYLPDQENSAKVEVSALSLAGQKALALRELRIASGSWDDWADELSSATPSVLTCLYSIVPDQLDLLRAIAPSLSDPITSGQFQAYRKILHILLSNPLRPEAQAEQLTILLEEIPVSQRLSIIELLYQYRPSLLANIKKEVYQPSLSLAKTNALPHSIPDYLSAINKYYSHAKSLHLVNRKDEEIQNLVNNINLAHNLQTKLTSSLALLTSLRSQQDNDINAWKQVGQSSSEPQISSLIYLLVQIENGQLQTAREFLNHQFSNAQDQASPFLALGSQILDSIAGDGQSDQGKMLTAVQQVLAHVESEIDPTANGVDLYELIINRVALGHLYKWLSKNGYWPEAQECIQFLVKITPGNSLALALMVESLHMTGDHQQALNTAHLLVTFDPESKAFRRILAKSMIYNHQWAQAIQELTWITANGDDFTKQDHYLLASSAIHNGQPESAIQVCQAILKQDDRDGIAYAILGNAVTDLENLAEADTYTQQAVNLTPEHPFVWLSLANLYSHNQRLDDSLQTLKKACQLIPDSPEIHLALAERYQDQNSPTQAVMELKQADKLINSTPVASTSFSITDIVNTPVGSGQTVPVDYYKPINRDFLSSHQSHNQFKGHVASLLGSCLLQLSHTEQAAGRLHQASKQFPNNLEVASQYARALIAQTRYHDALIPLEKVLQSNPQGSAPYLDYASALIALSDQGNQQLSVHATSLIDLQPANLNNAYLDKAIETLRSLLQRDPSLPDAKVLLAEGLYRRGELEKAFDLLNEAMTSEIRTDIIWKDRIAIDLSAVASKLNRHELALTALLEADQTNPRVGINLAEIYANMGLLPESKNAAQQVLNNQPDDVDSLVWFARFLQRLNEHNDSTLPELLNQAIQAVQKAINLAPNRGDLWVLLGNLKLHIKDQEGAIEAFQKINPQTHLDHAIDVTVEDLFKAGAELLQLGESLSATACLEEALQTDIKISENHRLRPPVNSPSLLAILSTLSSAYQKSGIVEKAIQTIDQALTITPRNVDLVLTKADLLLSLHQNNAENIDVLSIPSQLIECINEALNHLPDQPVLLMLSTLLHRINGDGNTAIQATQKLLGIMIGNGEKSTATASKYQQPAQYSLPLVAAKTLAYDAAMASILGQTAPRYLLQENGDSIPLPVDNTAGAKVWLSYPDQLDYLYHLAYQAIKDDNQQLPQIMDRILAYGDTDARSISLQAWLAYLRGDQQAAVSLLYSAQERLQEDDSQSQPTRSQYPLLERLAAQYRKVNTLFLVADIASQMQQWDSALNSLSQAIKLSAQEPQAYLELAKTLVKRAEYQGLCAAIDSHVHAPGITVLSKPVYEKFLETIHICKQLSSSHSLDPEAASLIDLWESRGRAIFEPTQAHASMLPDSNPAALSTKLASLRLSKSSQAAHLAASQPATTPLAQIQQALILEEEHPDQALQLAKLARESLEQALQNTNTFSIAHDELDRTSLFPLVCALQARITNALSDASGELENALNAIEKALQLWPDEPAWHKLASDIYQRIDNSAQLPNHKLALSHMQQACNLDPSNWHYQLAYGNLLLNAHRYAQATEPLHRAAKLNPQNPSIWLRLAHAYLLDAKPEDAKRYLDRSLEISPENPEATILRGEIALQEGDFINAQKYAQVNLEQSGPQSGSLILLSKALVGLGQMVEAQSTLENIPPDLDDSLPLYLEHARLIRQTQAVPAAIEDLKTTIKKFPRHPAPYAYLSELLAETGELDAARQAAQYTLRLGHDLPDDQTFSEHARMHTLLGRLMRQSGQLDQAIQHLSEAIQLSPHELTAYLELGQTHLSRRKHQDAINTFNQAIEAFPDSPESYFQAGVALKEAKDYLKAEQMLRQAARLAPQDLAIQRQLGAIIALNLVHNRKS